jgi:molybdopterin-guanine dinucleotide biosynthesis protein A
VRTGIVLAGGRSARFGGDKLAERLDGGALLTHAIAAVGLVADEVIVAGRSIDAAPTTVRSVMDDEPFGGPLPALRGALDAARGSLAVVVGGDMPQLVPAVLQAMLDHLAERPAIDAVLLGQPPSAKADAGRARRRPLLPLVLRVAAAARAAAAATESGDRSLMGLVDRMADVELPAATWLALDPAGNTLLDVDTRADLERIRLIQAR